MSASSRALTPRQRQADALLAVVVFLTGIISAALSAISQIYGDEQAPLWQALIYLAVVSAPLAFRRVWPAPVLIIVSVAYFIGVSLRVPEVYAGNIAVFIALYTVGAWMANRRAAFVVRAAIIAGMFVWLLFTMYRDAIDTSREEDVIAGAMSPYLAYMLLNLLINVLYFAGAYFFGEHAWKSAMQRQALERRTADLEHEREVNAAQAVALERVRIARELHDVVAHHVSVMGVQAGAARMVIDQDPARSKEMLGGIEASARTAISELHHLLETLRSPDGEIEEARVHRRARRHRGARRRVERRGSSHRVLRRGRGTAGALRRTGEPLPHRPGVAHECPSSRGHGRHGRRAPALHGRRRRARSGEHRPACARTTPRHGPARDA